MAPLSRLCVGRKAALRPELWSRGLAPARRIMLVSEPKVWRLYGPQVSRAWRRAGWRLHSHLLPAGEAAKTWPAVSRLLRDMLRHGLGRDAALAALGGGTTLDAAGFAAAVYLRGIPWVSMPTTLLAQVDAGIGGKTALNLDEGKNLIGAFHQPLAVVCDTACLDSLPRRDLFSGLAEAIKLALVHDPSWLAALRRDWPRLRDGDPAALRRLVRRAAAAKLAIVARDPRETRSVRERLNFGHTVGHALEAAAGFASLRHGEAVACGMRAALRLSQAYAGLPAATAADLDGWLRDIPVPRLELRPSAVLAHLRRDKKMRRGRPRFVLLNAAGRTTTSVDVPGLGIREAVRSILHELRRPRPQGAQS